MLTPNYLPHPSYVISTWFCVNLFATTPANIDAVEEYIHGMDQRALDTYYNALQRSKQSLLMPTSCLELIYPSEFQTPELLITLYQPYSRSINFEKQSQRVNEFDDEHASYPISISFFNQSSDKIKPFAKINSTDGNSQFWLTWSTRLFPLAFCSCIYQLQVAHIAVATLWSFPPHLFAYSQWNIHLLNSP